MTRPCPGYEPNTLATTRHAGGHCCWACDHDWDNADCTCLQPPPTQLAWPSRPRHYDVTFANGHVEHDIPGWSTWLPPQRERAIVEIRAVMRYLDCHAPVVDVHEVTPHGHTRTATQARGAPPP